MAEAVMMKRGGNASLPSNFTGFASGTFTPSENIHDYTINHGLGAIPDMVIIYPISGTPTVNVTNGLLVAGRELQKATDLQWYSYGNMTFNVTAQRSDRSIYGESTNKNQGLIHADSETFTACTYHGLTCVWCADVTYRWMAFKQTIEEA